jgi:hypothetical protein
MKISKSKRVIMYYRIKKYLSEELSISRISRKLKVSRKTIYFYKSMDEHQFIEWNARANKKQLKLSIYEDVVKILLGKHQDYSAAQIHDRLLELNPKLEVTERTTFNFVQFIRDKYNIPKPSLSRRIYEDVEELAYGKQAQVDFGEYTMTDDEGRSKKVHFMVMVLSRSRFKYVYFQAFPFTAQTAVIAHEKAFEYIGGIPSEIVYDQDTVFLSNENKGDFLLTEVFQRYVSERKFLPDFLHKADPESKGKSESVVKYVKGNFLHGRTYAETDILNAQAISWLERTANGKIHSTTKKVPAAELQIELPELKTYYPISHGNTFKQYHLRKDHKVCYKGNFYTVPKGTYQGRGTKVFLMRNQDILRIYLEKFTGGKSQKKLIAEHTISQEKGKTIRNTDHLRDKEKNIRQIINQVTELFPDKPGAGIFLDKIYATKPRYIRDQLQVIKDVVAQTGTNIAGQSLEFCLKNKIFRATDFRDIALMFYNNKQEENATKTLSEDIPVIIKIPAAHLVNATPDTSRINTYEIIITNH